MEVEYIAIIPHLRLLTVRFQGTLPFSGVEYIANILRLSSQIVRSTAIQRPTMELEYIALIPHLQLLTVRFQGTLLIREVGYTVSFLLRR